MTRARPFHHREHCPVLSSVLPVAVINLSASLKVRNGCYSSQAMLIQAATFFLEKKGKLVICLYNISHIYIEMGKF